MMNHLPALKLAVTLLTVPTTSRLFRERTQPSLGRKILLFAWSSLICFGSEERKLSGRPFFLNVGKSARCAKKFL